jgi:hypothetical protein
MVAVDYDENATCPEFEKAVAATSNDPEVVAFRWRRFASYLDGHLDHAARERAFEALGEQLGDRLRGHFAPESVALEREATKTKMEAVEELFDDPVPWLTRPVHEPEWKARIETGDFPEESFVAWLQNAARTITE